jgi:Tol biopolymer transport system component
VRNATGDGADEVLQKQQRAYPTDWSHDGQYLLFTIDAGATGKDVWVYDFARKTSRPLIDSSFNEYGAVFSPDGKWVAYVAAEARDPQIYIRAFADAGMKIAVTTGGGRQPSWNRTGSQLFYLSADTTLMAATVNGRVVGEPKPLFRTNVDPSRVLRNQYVVTPDGTRIMLLSPTVHSAASPLVGVLHWTNGLQAR